jgi:hypothetical protein
MTHNQNAFIVTVLADSAGMHVGRAEPKFSWSFARRFLLWLG